MSFKENQREQMTANDRLTNMTKREKEFLENSWATQFAKDIFPNICESRFAVLYSNNRATRPNTPVNVIVGAMILKELLQISDEEVMASLMFDIRMQYALHTTSYAEQPISDRTFSRFRERLYQYEQETGIDLIKEEILSLSGKLAKMMNLQAGLKRMDSLMIASNCKNMTRLEVIYTTTANLVNAVHRAGSDDLLQAMEQYLKTDDKNRVIYHNKAEDRESKMQAIIEDCEILLDRLTEVGASLPEYGIAKRMLDEQSDIGSDMKRKIKNSHTISPKSLQNPSDPEATYRKKAGKDNIGYVGNVVETFNHEGAGVISDYSLEQNVHSDSAFCGEAIEHIAETDSPTEAEKIVLIADGAYSGADNEAYAELNNISLVTTDLTGAKPAEAIADFKFDEEGKQVLQCPAGLIPIQQRLNQSNETIRITMKRDACANCPYREACKAKIYKRHASVIISEKKVERARSSIRISSDEYAMYRNARNAVEGMPSILRRRYRVDEMPVYGLLKSKMLLGLKIGALNFKKLAKYTREKCAHLNLNPNTRVECV